MSYSDEVLTDNPLGYWKLDETGGTTAADTAVGHDGTYINTPTLGQAGNGFLGLAAEFDPAIPEYVTVADHADFDLGNGAWTVEAWCYLDTTAADPGRAIMSKGDGGFLVRVTNTPTADVQVVRSHQSFIGNSNIDITAAGWYYIAVTYAGSNGTLNYYVNDQTDSSAGTGADFTSTAVDLHIGRDVDEAPWDGRLQHVALYGTALSAARVDAHYQAGITAQSSPAELYVTHRRLIRVR